MNLMFGVAAAWLVAYLSYTWAISHSLRINGRIDQALLYQGSAAGGTPYVNNAQVSSPVLYAFLRLLVVKLGDGSFETQQMRLTLLSILCASLLLVCIFLAMYQQLKNQEKPSALKAAAFFSVCAIGMVPASRDIALGNVNIWVASLVVVYLFLWNTSNASRANFAGGLFLGIAFMFKPYLLLVLVFLFFFCMWNRNFSTLCGLAVGTGTCFFASFLISGIGIDSYRIFFIEIPRQFLNQHTQLTTNNLSLTQYVPQLWKGAVAPIGFSALSLVALMASKRSQREDVMVWFFITNLCYPIIWPEHLTAIIPAALFLILKKDEKTSVIMAAVVVYAMFFAGIWKFPPLVAMPLIFAWSWQIRKRLAIEIPFRPTLPSTAAPRPVSLQAAVQE
jgi:hypothetical protein